MHALGQIRVICHLQSWWHEENYRTPGRPIHLHAHKLRHTSTKKVYQTKGPVEAKSFGRHRSFKQLKRYPSQTREEREAMVDNV